MRDLALVTYNKVMNQYIAVLGRQPEFGLAELESLLGADAITPLPNGLALVSSNHSLPFARFGSVIKFATLQQQLAHTNQDYVCTELAQLLQRLHPHEPGVKLKIGISDYSNTFSARTVNALGLRIKKILKNNGYSARIVPNKTAKLGSAQIIHNNLTREHGAELVLCNVRGSHHVAVTTYEQDIEAYTARDQARPMRDARVGMLPPKLAQTIINLATGPIGVGGIEIGNQENPISPVSSTRSPSPEDGNTKYEIRNTILDPFCGTGVILQEAGLMGYATYGTDLEERMIRYSRDNIQWLQKSHNIHFEWFLEVGDAATHTWRQPINFIAAETYLGRPLSSLPSRADLMDIVQSVNTLHKKVLKNLHAQIAPETRICLAVPAWQTPSGYITLPILDQIDKMGYNQLVFSQTNARNLIYARTQQIVGRQLVVLQKQ